MISVARAGMRLLFFFSCGCDIGCQGGDATALFFLLCVGYGLTGGVGVRLIFFNNSGLCNGAEAGGGPAL